MSGAYYNENDAGAAAWLRELIRRNLIAPGDVDTRSIEDVRPIELRGYTQCHFFAGIAGWSRALRLAGWPDDRRVWTGSCPCQPFSDAGAGAGFADQRHLWPSWLHLIAQCGPTVVFGEQVASAAALLWWDLVSADLEGQGYACAAADLAAAGVGAPHIRQRLFWLADAAGPRRCGLAERVSGSRGWPAQESGRLRAVGGMADADANGLGAASVEGLRDAEHHAQPRGSVVGLGDTGRAGAWRYAGTVPRAEGGACVRAVRDCAEPAGAADRGGALHGFWSAADWLGCRDGKWRPVEPGTFPLAHGLPARVGRLRGYGNAIVPQVAAEFVAAYVDARAAA